MSAPSLVQAQSCGRIKTVAPSDGKLAHIALPYLLKTTDDTKDYCMLLKVGELAKRTGLTVRTLHHYDAIGLLAPSARSDAGYRLYNREDIARLHTIQALRQIGLPLSEIDKLLHGKPEPLPSIIQRQLTSLERQMTQAGELHARLSLLQSSLAKGVEPDMDQWLATLTEMSIYGKHFNASEIKKIRENWQRTGDQWPPLLAAVRDAMERGIPADSLEIQPLARRWMELQARFMQGDFALMERWHNMYWQEPSVQGKDGFAYNLVSYIAAAADLRLQSLLKYFTHDELRRLNADLDQEWQAFNDTVHKLVQANVSCTSKKAREVLMQWSALIDCTVGHDPDLRHKLLHAFGADPLLRAGSPLDPACQRFIREAWEWGTSDSAIRYAPSRTSS